MISKKRKGNFDVSGDVQKKSLHDVMFEQNSEVKEEVSEEEDNDEEDMDNETLECKFSPVDIWASDGDNECTGLSTAPDDSDKSVVNEPMCSSKSAFLPSGLDKYYDSSIDTNSLQTFNGVPVTSLELYLSKSPKRDTVQSEGDIQSVILQPECNIRPPNTLSHFQWMNEALGKRFIPFTGNPGLKVPVTNNTPIGFFNLVFTEKLINLITTESNKYGSKLFASSKSGNSRISRWKDMDSTEIKTFLGLLFLMGIIRLNRLSDYWKTHYLFRLPFCNYMSRDRFFLILKVLNFSSSDPLVQMNQIYPLVDYFNSTMEEVYAPEKDLIIDDTMVVWGNRLFLKRSTCFKRHKYGMKVHVLAETGGLVQKLCMHTDKGNTNEIADVVNDLLTGKVGLGHSVYMNSVYCSATLAADLINESTYCTGILCPKRKDNPEGIVNAKLQKGETVIQYSPQGVFVSKWKDVKEILAISTEFDGTDIEATQTCRNESTGKPRMMVEYSKQTKSVFNQGQILNYYPSHKSLCWSKKMAIHVLHLILINSYYLFKKYNNNSSLDLHDFQVQICENFLPDYPTPPKKLPDSIHLPVYLPRAENNRIKKKRCRECAKTKIRKDTPYTCSNCPDSPGLCIGNCFKEYHNY